MYKHSWHTVDQGMGIRCDKCNAHISMYDNDFLEKETEESCLISDEQFLTIIPLTASIPGA